MNERTNFGYVRSTTEGSTEYPFLWAMANAIFLLFALGVVLDPEPQEFFAKVTSSAALLAAGIKQAPGLQPDRSPKARIFTGVFLAADVVLIALIWTVR